MESNSLGTFLGSFSESLDALRATCTVLERKCTNLNWALEEANRKLRESLDEREQLASRLDSILRCLSAGVIAVDLQGRLIEFNQAAARITGRAPETVLGTQYQDKVGRGVAERLTPLHTMDTGSPMDNGEKQITTAKGDRIPVGFSTSLVRGEGGEILGAVEVFRDLRRAKLLEEELLRTRTLAAVGEMAAEVASEVRNPLAGLAGFAELLARDLASDPARAKLVAKVQQGVAGVERAVSRLLENARPLPAEFITRDVVPILEQVLDLFEEDPATTGGIRLLRRLSGSKLLVRFNEEQLRQAVWNVLLNAREAMDNEGAITVSVGVSGTDREDSRLADGDCPPFVHVCIADTGRGMTPEVAEQACSPFFTTKEKGAGLGLTTVRRIVTSHGGEVHLESRPGGPTAVTIRLPSATTSQVKLWKEASCPAPTP
ncbi:MAG: PAS domain S-box protein [Candidatus Eisenbacteria sp.]|nr:PAS domain S-box protein [Candidatus Eisenbacteria bacterium]